MKKKIILKGIISLGLLLFLAFNPHIMPVSVNIAQASEVDKIGEVRLNLKSVTLATGKSFTLRVYNLDKDAKVSFKSANPEIASVSETGVITGNKVGTTTITVTIKRGFNSTTLTCDVTVGPPAFSVKLIHSRIIIGIDQNFLLEALIKPVNTVEAVKFSSKNPAIATVSTGGRVTAKKVGMTYVFAEIDATNQDGTRKFSSCSVIVTKPEDVEPLNKYFEDHPELGLIPEIELSNALFKFFNSLEAPVDYTGTTDGSTGDQETQGTAVADTATGSATGTETAAATPSNAEPATDSDTADAAPEQAAEQTEPSLVEKLDKYLNTIFDMAELRQKYEERLQIATGASAQ